MAASKLAEERLAWYAEDRVSALRNCPKPKKTKAGLVLGTLDFHPIITPTLHKLPQASRSPYMGFRILKQA